MLLRSWSAFVSRFRRSAGVEARVDIALDRPIAPLNAFAEAALGSTRATALERRYGFARAVGPRSSLHLGTLFLLDLLDRTALARPEAFARLPIAPEVLDVGARDFESALALALFIARFDPARPRAPRLTGIELDAEAETRPGLSCRAASRAHLARARACIPGEHRYLEGDVLEHVGRYDLVTWLHPFVDAERLVEWGLAPGHFRPRELHAHVAGLLRPAGLLVIVNQDPDENEAERALLAELDVRVDAFTLEPFFRAREVPCFVHLVSSNACARAAQGPSGR